MKFHLLKELDQTLIFSCFQLDAWIKESLTNQTSPINLVDDYLHKKIRVRKEQNN